MKTQTQRTRNDGKDVGTRLNSKVLPVPKMKPIKNRPDKPRPDTGRSKTQGSEVER